MYSPTCISLFQAYFCLILRYITLFWAYCWLILIFFKQYYIIFMSKSKICNLLFFLVVHRCTIDALSLLLSVFPLWCAHFFLETSLYFGFIFGWLIWVLNKASCTDIVPFVLVFRATGHGHSSWDFNISPLNSSQSSEISTKNLTQTASILWQCPIPSPRKNTDCLIFWLLVGIISWLP